MLRSRPSKVTFTALMGAFFLLLTAGSVAVAPSAEAYPFIPGYRPDSVDHWYCFGSVPGLDQPRVHNAMATLNVQTDLYEVFSPTCGQQTDVVWEFPGYCETPGGGGCPLGRTICQLMNNWGSCESFSVYVDNVNHYYRAANFVAAFGGDLQYTYDVNLDLTVCHELGHTAGVAHWTSQPADPYWRCMNSAWILPLNYLERLNYMLYSDIHVGEINANN